MADPWTMERRSAKSRKITSEAERSAARLGAKAVYLVAFFEDGEHIHMLDGGTLPVAQVEFHKTMVANLEKLKLSGGEDVSVQ